MSILPLAGLLTGSLLAFGIAILLIIVLAVRRRHQHCAGGHCNHQLDPSKQPKITPQPSRPNSMLEINTGDHRYVVAYTLKPVGDCVGQQPVNSTVEHQPDILNTPRGRCCYVEFMDVRRKGFMFVKLTMDFNIRNVILVYKLSFALVPYNMVKKLNHCVAV